MNKVISLYECKNRHSKFEDNLDNNLAYNIGLEKIIRKYHESTYSRAQAQEAINKLVRNTVYF